MVIFQNHINNFNNIDFSLKLKFIIFLNGYHDFLNHNVFPRKLADLRK